MTMFNIHKGFWMCADGDIRRMHWGGVYAEVWEGSEWVRTTHMGKLPHQICLDPQKCMPRRGQEALRWIMQPGNQDRELIDLNGFWMRRVRLSNSGLFFEMRNTLDSSGQWDPASHWPAMRYMYPASGDWGDGK